MTSFDRFERSLPALFDELATPVVPDYFDDLLTRTQATSQRPEWHFPERWLPMTSFAARIAATPRIPWRPAAIVAMLAVAAVVAALVAGSFSQRPSIYSPGRNGEVILVTKSGDIVAADPATGLTRLLVSGQNVPANTKPIVSPDGTKFLMLRPAAAGAQDIFVVDLNGNQTLITPDALTAYHYIGWSPLGDRILIRDDGGRILLLDATKPAPPFSISRNIEMGDLWLGNGFNYRSTNAFRPPAGDEIMFVGNGNRTLAAIRQDGTGLRTILDVQGAHLGVTIDAMQWSPDGSRIVFLVQQDSDGPHSVCVVNADGSGVRELSHPGEHWSPLWSPDGKSVAFEYWTPAADQDAPWDFHPIAVMDVATGQVREVGVGHKDGYLSWEWSPDGTSILEVPMDGTGKVVIVDVATGAEHATPWEVDQPISWQRLAPD